MKTGKILVAVLLGTFLFHGFALFADNATEDPSSPDFVTASLLIISPGDTLYSCAGHVCLRMECPAHKLDYCFSYESEDVKDRVLSFFAGKLKMGMFCVPTSDFLKQYKEEGRGVTQYKLNLPPAAKQKLWKILDDKVGEGANLPYDYIKRGCARGLMVLLRDAVHPVNIKANSWIEQYRDWTLREIVSDGISDALHPWTKLLLWAIVGAETDRKVSDFEKIVTPKMLTGFLKNATVGDEAFIQGEGVCLTSVVNKRVSPMLTPLAVAWLLVALSVANLFVKKSCGDIIFLVVQSVFGAFMSYLLFVSDLPVTSWNWLFVPFNLLPALFWKWRRKWALAFAAILILWEAGMIFYPHQLTDPAYLVLVFAYIVFYFKFALKKPLCIRKESK